MSAFRITITVNKRSVIAGRLKGVATLHLHTFDERSKEILSVLVRNYGLVSKDVANKCNHLLSTEFVGIILRDLRVKVTLEYSAWRSSTHETHV